MSWAPFIAGGRDVALRDGRAKAGGGTIYYTLPGHMFTNTSNASTTANTDQYTPFWVHAPIVADEMAIEVGTLESGKSCRIGIYAANADWQPIGPPLADSGDLDMTTSGVKTYSPASPLYLQRGQYLAVVNQNGTGTGALKYQNSYLYNGLDTTLGGANNINYYVTRTYAAFPTPGTAWVSKQGSAAGHRTFVVLRISAP